jgi:hypothetical protein
MTLAVRIADVPPIQKLIQVCSKGPAGILNRWML